MIKKINELVDRILTKLKLIKYKEKFLRKETSHQKLATAIYKAVVQYKNEYEKKAAANAKDVKEDAKKQTAALRYSVQFYTGARKSINAKEFKSCVPARESDLGKGIYSYTYGNEQTYEKAKELLAKVRKDFSDAFLVVYKNGERTGFHEINYKPYINATDL